MVVLNLADLKISVFSNVTCRITKLIDLLLLALYAKIRAFTYVHMHIHTRAYKNGKKPTQHTMKVVNHIV